MTFKNKRQKSHVLIVKCPLSAEFNLTTFVVRFSVYKSIVLRQIIYMVYIMKHKINKQTVCITGAGSGLGKEAAIAIARKGHKVIATVLYEEQIERLECVREKENLDIEIIKIDLTNEKDREKLLDYNIDVYISNAAIADSGSIAEVNVERIEDVFKINVFSNIRVAQIVLKNMIEKKGKGKVVFISSQIGRIALPFLGPYASSKFAIEGFASCLRDEMKILNKLEKTNIQVGIIEPGSYATGFNMETGNKMYSWMQEKSYFKSHLDLIRKIESKVWQLTELDSYDSIIKKYIKVVECRKIKRRYYAPWYQSLGIQILRIFGK